MTLQEIIIQVSEENGYNFDPYEYSLKPELWKEIAKRYAKAKLEEASENNLKNYKKFNDLSEKADTVTQQVKYEYLARGYKYAAEQTKQSIK